MSQETQQALLENVKSWLTIDNEIRALQKEIKETRKMKRRRMKKKKKTEEDRRRQKKQ